MKKMTGNSFLFCCSLQKRRRKKSNKLHSPVCIFKWMIIHVKSWFLIQFDWKYQMAFTRCKWRAMPYHKIPFDTHNWRCFFRIVLSKSSITAPNWYSWTSYAQHNAKKTTTDRCVFWMLFCISKEKTFAFYCMSFNLLTWNY